MLHSGEHEAHVVRVRGDCDVGVYLSSDMIDNYTENRQFHTFCTVNSIEFYKDSMTKKNKMKCLLHYFFTFE